MAYFSHAFIVVACLAVAHVVTADMDVAHTVMAQVSHLERSNQALVQANKQLTNQNLAYARTV